MRQRKEAEVFLKENESYSSPTVSLEGLLASLVIHVVEKRNVAIFDVPGAYLHAKMPDDKRTLMVLRGDFADIMCQVNPEYERFTKGEGKNKVLCAIWMHRVGIVVVQYIYMDASSLEVSTICYQ